MTDIVRNLLLLLSTTTLLVFQTFGLKAQTPSVHDFTISNHASGDAFVIATLDQGYLVLSSEIDLATGVGYLIAMKTDSAGNVGWINNLGGYVSDISKPVQTSDSGFAICYLDIQTYSYRFIKLSSMGNIILQATLDVSSPLQFYFTPRILPRAGGGYYIGGTTYDSIANQTAFALISLNESMNVNWSKLLHRSYDKNYLNAMDTSSTGNIVLLGTYYEMSLNLHTPVLVCVDTYGNTLWSRHYVCSNTDLMASSVEILPGDEIAVVAKRSNSSSIFGTALMKTDSLGNELWTLLYTASQSLYPTEVMCVEDKHLVITGLVLPGSFSIKVDSSGTLVNSHYYPSIEFISMDSANGPFYCFAGPDAQTAHLRLMITDTSGNSCIAPSLRVNKTALDIFNMPSLPDSLFSVEVTFGSQSDQPVSIAHSIVCSDVTVPEHTIDPVQLFPNPAAEIVHVTATQPFEIIEIIDAHGKVVQTQQCNSANVAIDVSDLSVGLYFVRIQTKDGLSNRKLLIER